MQWNFQDLQNQANQEAAGLDSLQAVDAFRVKYLGKKGIVAAIFASLGGADGQQKAAIGKGANDLRGCVEQSIERKITAVGPHPGIRRACGYFSAWLRGRPWGIRIF